ncbi:MAG: UbiA prenyltransferase family protein [Thermoplasmata archaeon]|nr:UbiA prenyltransferase family protein [Thermoplasmata archaeon]
MHVKDVFLLVRPFTLLAPFIAVLFGTIFQLAWYDELDIFWNEILKIIAAALALAAAQAVGQIINQVEDVEIDKANGKDYRPIASGRMRIEEAQIIAWIFAVFALLVSYPISIPYGIFITIFLLFGVFYNIEPFRFKKRLWINTLSLAISRGLLPLPAAWSVFGNVGDTVPWLIGSIMAVWVLAWQNTKDIDDIEGDLKYGVVTPAAYHGIKNLARIIAFLSFLSFFLLFIYINTNMISKEMATLFILAIPTAWMLYKLYTQDFEHGSLENNDLWAAYYLTLAGFYIIAAATYLIRPYITLFS